MSNPNRICKLQNIASSQNYCAFNDIFKFSYIPRPGEVFQCLHNSGRDLCNGLPHFSAVFFHKMQHEQRNVVLPLFQRRHSNREHVQAIKKIFPEPSRLDLFLKITVCRCNDPDVHFDREGTAQLLEFPVFNDPEQFCLEFERKIPDLIEKNGSSVGKIEPADLGCVSTSECPLLPAEELALDEACRKCRAIDHYHRPIPAVARLMDSSCHHSFPCPGLSSD